MQHALIMAGGSGTRFWPASRRLRPKQLLNLVGERTMIQDTVSRIQGFCPADRVLIMTNQSLVPEMRRQLPELPPSAFVGEPEKRDTAPCIALAAALIAARDAEGVMAVMPSDHVISPDSLFVEALNSAADLVEADPKQIVTFGIEPTYPAEVFGYIEREPDHPVSARFPAWKVSRFREKPDAATAAEFVSSGNFYWNSGIFVWKAATILETLRSLEPEMMRHVDIIAANWNTPQRDTIFASEFAAIQGKSIDYAVMERYDHVSVIRAPFQWDDLGSWLSLARLRGSDESGNTLAGNSLAVRTENTIVRSNEEHLVVTLGVSNLIIVHTSDATLVASRDDEAAVREIVDLLQKDLRGNRYL